MWVLSADTVQHQREPFANSILSLVSALPLAAKVPVKLVRSDAVITAFTLLPNAKLQAQNGELHFCQYISRGNYLSNFILDIIPVNC